MKLLFHIYCITKLLVLIAAQQLVMFTITNLIEPPMWKLIYNNLIGNGLDWTAMDFWTVIWT